jgi:hypothetical protein
VERLRRRAWRQATRFASKVGQTLDEGIDYVGARVSPRLVTEGGTFRLISGGSFGGGTPKPPRLKSGKKVKSIADALSDASGNPWNPRKGLCDIIADRIIALFANSGKKVEKGRIYINKKHTKYPIPSYIYINKDRTGITLSNLGQDSYHEFAIIDGLVYDAVTGPNGIPFDEYIKFFESPLQIGILILEREVVE